MTSQNDVITWKFFEIFVRTFLSQELAPLIEWSPLDEWMSKIVGMAPQTPDDKIVGKTTKLTPQNHDIGQKHPPPPISMLNDRFFIPGRCFGFHTSTLKPGERGNLVKGPLCGATSLVPVSSKSYTLFWVLPRYFVVGCLKIIHPILRQIKISQSFLSHCGKPWLTLAS